MPKHNPRHSGYILYVIIVLSGILYVAIGYFVPRYETAFLLSLYIVLFGGYLILYYLLKADIKTGIFAAIAFRLLLLFSIPALSDDVYRFIWDGRLLASGINPFDEVPDFYIIQDLGIPGIDQSLYANLNFTLHHTMYPPVAQFTGWVAALIASNSVFWSVVVIRTFILTADIGSIFLIRKLLEVYKVKKERVLLYALNPLVILELTGNLHHEAFVLLFLLLAILLLNRDKQVKSAISFGLAVGSKLIPVIFLPLLISRLGIKRTVVYGLVMAGVTFILFIPFINEQLMYAFMSSGSLYFLKFEFNASIYYLIREVGYWVKGYNIIQSAGPWLAAITVAAIVLLAVTDWKRKMKLPEAFMWVLLIYVAFTTTLHPWYIVPLLAFSVFTSYRFPLVWTMMIFLTYSGYSADGFSENLYIIFGEYFVVYGYMLYELIWYNRSNSMKQNAISGSY